MKKIIASALVAATMTAAFASAEQAAAASFNLGAAALAKNSGAVSVDWHGHGHGWGWGPGALIGGIIGGALIAAAISEHRAAPSDMDRCARDFPDFSYRTGTYIDRRGIERVCPYLR